jgi:hypothetical protein
MTDPLARRRLGQLNFTGFQFILFAGAGVVGLAALLAAGLAFGLALAGASVLAVLVLAVWFIAANMIGGTRPSRRPPPAP